jgi:hypothetical protein
MLRTSTRDDGGGLVKGGRGFQAVQERAHAGMQGVDAVVPCRVGGEEERVYCSWIARLLVL